MSVLPTGIAAASGGYEISRSVRLRSSASAYLNRTAGTPTNQIKWTFSGWIKRGSLGVYSSIISGGTTANDYSWYGFDNNDKFQIIHSIGGAGQSDSGSVSTAVFRDPSAWYHVVIVYDSANATSANRTILYVNGIQQTLSAFPSLNETSSVNANSVTQYIANRGYSALYNDCYITEVNFIDGQALTPSSFGENDATTGVWKPKRYTGTYGTNGFYLNFSDNSAATAAAIGKDSSGNGNNWTPNNISVTAGATYDSMLDTPTPYADGGNGRGNYCVVNPLQNGGTLTNGNLNLVGNSGSATGTVGVTSGKWYWEVTATTMGTSAYIGVSDETWFGTGSSWSYSQVWVYINTGLKGGNGSTASYGASYTTGNVIGVALDMDAGTLTFYKDNTSQTTAFSTGIAGKVMRPFLATASASNTTLDANFGQRPFTHTPPTGFKALNTQNLPDATITKGSKHFDVRTWSGDSVTPKAVVTDLAFTPDLIWAKTRSTTYDHMLFDSVRGAGSAKDLSSNTTGAEGATGATYGYVSSIDSAGFTVTKGSGATNILNQSGQTFAAWQWKAGGAAVSNTAGSITSQVSANASAGFSIVTFTGTGAAATVGHGLGVAPKMVIVKARGAATNLYWRVRHESLSANLNLLLNTTDSGFNAVTVSTGGGVSNLTSTTFGLVTGTTNTDYVNQSGITYLAYCFSEVAGYSKFGSYTGNGSADGPFVYCGFRPRWVMVKRTDTTDDWVIIDTSRNTYNVAGSALYPNSSSSETTNGWYNIDVTSNGFKARASNTPINASGGTYIFAAFAENPFKNSLAR